MKARSHSLTLTRALGLCLALLWAQGLGYAHAVVHGSGLPAPAASRSQDGPPRIPAPDPSGAAQHPAGGSHAGDWLGGLHQAGDTDCRLVDQLTHADLLWAPPLAAAPGPRPGARPAERAWAVPWQPLPAAYLARGPPAIG